MDAIIQQTINDLIVNDNTMLDLSYMCLKKLPSNIPSSVKRLYIYHNAIEELPSNFDQLFPLLEQLYCHFNCLKVFPNLPSSLQILNISTNTIKELPSNLNQMCPFLQELYCDGNGIEKLNNNLPSTLLKLYCSDNYLKQLPDNLPSLIEELSFSYNQIVEFPLNMPHLRELFCHGNRYLYVPKRISRRYPLRADKTPNYNQKVRIIQRVWKAKKCRNIMVQMIHSNDNVLSNCFKSYGDLNIVCLITNYAY